jgi:hypothetical protein
MSPDRIPMFWSKLVSALTLGYGVFALLKPRHLGRQMEAPAHEVSVYDQMARTYGGRDLAISGLALASRAPTLVSAAMALRVAGDLTDAAVLGAAAPNAQVRTKMLAATLGWATLNAVALAADRARL